MTHVAPARCVILEDVNLVPRYARYDYCFVDWGAARRII